MFCCCLDFIVCKYPSIWKLLLGLCCWFFTKAGIKTWNKEMGKERIPCLLPLKAYTSSCCVSMFLSGKGNHIIWNHTATEEIHCWKITLAWGSGQASFRHQTVPRLGFGMLWCIKTWYRGLLYWVICSLLEVKCCTENHELFLMSVSKFLGYFCFFHCITCFQLCTKLY